MKLNFIKQQTHKLVINPARVVTSSKS